MSSLLTDLVAFLDEHRQCGDLDAGVEDEQPGYVWMECEGCGARIARYLDDR